MAGNNEQFPVATRRLVAVMVAVVVSFLLATFFGQYRETAIDRGVDQIVANAMPSIQELARARTNLHHIAEAMDRFVQTAGADEVPARQSVTVLRHKIDASLSAYLALPFFPGEALLYQGIRDGLAGVDAATSRVFEAMHTGDAQQVRQRLGEFHDQVSLADDAFFTVIDFDTVQGQRLGLSIANVREESMLLNFALDVLSIALAVVATIAMLRSVRLYRRSMRALEEQKRTAQERASELELFAGRVAHDLRSPLSAIVLRTSAGKQVTSPEQCQEGLVQIGRSADRMERMIDGLLVFARAGARPQPGARADLAAVVDDVVASVEPDVEEIRAQLSVEKRPGALWVACTSGALTSVLSNLLHNAIKYVVDGKEPLRRIDVRLEARGDRARVTVQDNGPGIPAGQEDRVFEPYVRLKATSSQPGMGLGLATVKRIVEAHGGSVGVDSVPDRGSSFWFTMPLAPSEGAGAKMPASYPATPPAGGA